jgi:hypothetical protein
MLMMASRPEVSFDQMAAPDPEIKKAYDSVRREVLYSILIEFGVPMKPVRLIKMCLRNI